MKNNGFLECEKEYVYLILIFVAGFFGAYTYVLKGGVFCNAQTGNLVYMAISIGKGDFIKTLYYFLPFLSYLFGTIISEILPGVTKRAFSLRWDSILVLIEILAALIVGFLPDNVPVQLSQIIIAFVCSMQYNTFRQSEGIPMATTFCTNHVRQFGIYIAKSIKHKEKSDYLKRVLKHLKMLTAFVLGGSISTLIGSIFKDRTILFAILPLGFLFGRLLYADLVSEKNILERKPSGH